MVKLNLVAKVIEQEKIKEYLENNISEALAEKINNGAQITKENTVLLNKKDLNGFWSYATSEAKKLVEKNSNSVYVNDEIVYGWAIHYFEEDSIEGVLYNQDGSEYKPKTEVTKQVESKPKASPKNTTNQSTLFDLFNLDNTDGETTENTGETEEIELSKNTAVDFETGEIIQTKEEQPYDIEAVKILHSILDGKLITK